MLLLREVHSILIRYLGFVFDLFAWMESVTRPMMFPDDEPVFQFKVGDPL